MTFKRPDELRLSVTALFGQTLPVETLVVVDNGSDVCLQDLLDAAEHLSSRPSIRLIATENVGPAGGLNLGLESLDGIATDDDWVLFLDDDDPLGEGFILERLVSRAEGAVDAHPGTVGVGLRGARFDRMKLRTRQPSDRTSRLVRVDHLHGGYFPLYRLGALRGCGGLRAELFWGFEELDLGLRLTDAGGLLWDTPDLLAATRATSKALTGRSRPRGRLEQPTARRYYTLRNLTFIGLTVGQRNVVIRALLLRALAKPIVNLPLHPVWAVRSLRMNVRAIRDGMAGRLGRTIDLGAGSPQ